MIPKIRIKKSDSRNFVIERVSEKGKWYPWAYYGKIDDMAIGLLNLLTEVPEGENLIDQIRDLILEVDKAKKEITLKLGDY